MALTKHAKDRIQQRGIPALALTLLQEFGLEEYSRGSVIRYFDKKSLKKALSQVKLLTDRMDELNNIYCVESDDGMVITTGHRHNRVIRNSKQLKRKSVKH